MINLFHKSLRNKLLIAFMGIGFLPYLFFLIYTLFLSESKIINKITQEHFDSAFNVIHLIDNHLQSLRKEVVFLSQLDINDDILADDLDKRISRLLTQKVNDYNLDLTLMVVNLNNKIIASSNKDQLLKIFKPVNLLPLTTLPQTTLVKANKISHSYSIIDKNLYIYSQIRASFDKKKSLGFLVLAYNLENLKLYLSHHDGVHNYLIDTKNKVSIGDSMLSFKVNIKKQKEGIIQNEHLIIYSKMKGILKKWTIIYATDQDKALAFLYDFIRFMLYMSPFVLMVIIFVAIRYSSFIVKPIQQLTIATDHILKTQDYSIQLETNPQIKDEISRLSISFNNMVATTNKALKDLEKENKLRLQRFIHLIELLNTIIETKTEKQCIEVSLQQMKHWLKHEKVNFTPFKELGENSIRLYVTDFENERTIYYGAILLGNEFLKDSNEQRFYQSIATMIMLQLDRIRLIERTLSASHAKSAFISNMSHELRTPLNAIIGFSQFLITYEELTEDQMDTVASIESSAQYLLSMINEILDIAKIEAGKMEAHLEEVDLFMLVQSAYEMLQPLAQDKKLEFELITENLSLSNYQTDPKLFKQIVINLLSNAIKFTEKGKITLELSSDKKQVKVSVKDSGIGLSKENLKQLFTDFTQVENMMQKKHKGTGLGLSLSKKLAQLLSGDVWLESDGLNQGTRSYFIIHLT